MNEIIDRHETVVLRWSGGKDSTAALYYCKPWWEKIQVLWVNTGAAFPEVIALADKVRAIVPYFVEVKTNQPEQTARNGYPVDVMTARATFFGKLLEENERPTEQIHWACCAANIWKPMHDATREIGATLVITGQKNADTIKPPIRTGYIDEDGVEYWLPLEDWSVPEVFAYLKEVGAPMLPHYGPGSRTGLDCWDCSAYVFENFGRYEWMKQAHPEKWAVLKGRLKAILGEAKSETKLLEDAVGD